MKIVDALAQVRRLYIDTAPLIYYVEINPIYAPRMDAIITWLENNAVESVSSVIALTEVLTQPKRLNDHLLIKEYRDVLANNADYRLLPVTEQIAETASDLRARYNLRTPDALHIATAINSRCQAFLTNDTSLRRVNEVAVLILDDLEL